MMVHGALVFLLLAGAAVMVVCADMDYPWYIPDNEGKPFALGALSLNATALIDVEDRGPTLQAGLVRKSVVCSFCTFPIVQLWTSFVTTRQVFLVFSTVQRFNSSCVSGDLSYGLFTGNTNLSYIDFTRFHLPLATITNVADGPMNVVVEGFGQATAGSASAYVSTTGDLVLSSNARKKVYVASWAVFDLDLCYDCGTFLFVTEVDGITMKAMRTVVAWHLGEAFLSVCLSVNTVTALSTQSMSSGERSTTVDRSFLPEGNALVEGSGRIMAAFSASGIIPSNISVVTVDPDTFHVVDMSNTSFGTGDLGQGFCSSWTFRPLNQSTYETQFYIWLQFQGALGVLRVEQRDMQVIQFPQDVYDGNTEFSVDGPSSEPLVVAQLGYLFAGVASLATGQIVRWLLPMPTDGMINGTALPYLGPGVPYFGLGVASGFTVRGALATQLQYDDTTGWLYVMMQDPSYQYQFVKAVNAAHFGADSGENAELVEQELFSSTVIPLPGLSTERYDDGYLLDLLMLAPAWPWPLGVDDTFVSRPPAVLTATIPPQGNGSVLALPFAYFPLLSCAPGWIMTPDGCVPAQGGTFASSPSSDDIRAAYDCPLGTTSRPGSFSVLQCLACAYGFYSSTVDRSSCVACSESQYCPAGASSALPVSQGPDGDARTLISFPTVQLHNTPSALQGVILWVGASLVCLALLLLVFVLPLYCPADKQSMCLTPLVSMDLYGRRHFARVGERVVIQKTVVGGLVTLLTGVASVMLTASLLSDFVYSNRIQQNQFLPESGVTSDNFAQDFTASVTLRGGLLALYNWTGASLPVDSGDGLGETLYAIACSSLLSQGQDVQTLGFSTALGQLAGAQCAASIDGGTIRVAWTCSRCSISSVSAISLPLSYGAFVTGIWYNLTVLDAIPGTSFVSGRIIPEPPTCSFNSVFKGTISLAFPLVRTLYVDDSDTSSGSLTDEDTITSSQRQGYQLSYSTFTVSDIVPTSVLTPTFANGPPVYRTSPLWSSSFNPFSPGACGGDAFSGQTGDDKECLRVNLQLTRQPNVLKLVVSMKQSLLSFLTSLLGLIGGAFTVGAVFLSLLESPTVKRTLQRICCASWLHRFDAMQKSFDRRRGGEHLARDTRSTYVELSESVPE